MRSPGASLSDWVAFSMSPLLSKEGCIIAFVKYGQQSVDQFTDQARSHDQGGVLVLRPSTQSNLYDPATGQEN